MRKRFAPCDAVERRLPRGDRHGVGAVQAGGEGFGLIRKLNGHGRIERPDAGAAVTQVVGERHGRAVPYVVPQIPRLIFGQGTNFDRNPTCAQRNLS
nr:hypothetical protein [Alicyclobacillus cellulosilyticus]